MSGWLKFSLLWMLTGSPLTAGLVVVALWLVGDWYTVGVGRRLWRAWQDARRGARLERLLLVNPHDRKARADLADILVGQRRYARALEVVRPVVDADPEDLNGLHLLGIACLGSGRADQGEVFLGEVVKADPDFRHGDALLALGRWRAGRGDHVRAREALERFLAQHPASVEGRVRLAAVLAAQADAAGARAQRRRAWDEYATSQRWEQRRDRLWAWRANPVRPALYALALGMAIVVTATAVRHLPHGRQVDAEEEAP